MKATLIIALIVACVGCAPLTEQEIEAREYQRVDYLQSVFLPQSQACRRAGGFLVFADTSNNSVRHHDMTYADMRMAVSRGCGGI